MRIALATLVLLAASAAQAELPATLSLEEALKIARDRQPALRVARAQLEVQGARARESLAPVLPTISMALGYSRSTANFVARPGTLPSSVSAASSITLDSSDYWTSSLNANATLWDFGQGWFRYQSSLASSDAITAQEHAAEVATALLVRTVWFNAVAQRELVAVAKATYDNTEAHYAQVKGFVTVGTRPEIDLAQSRSERATARLAMITASNGYAVAKAKVNQAIGLEGPASWEVIGEAPGPIDGEEASSDALYTQALSKRPEVAALEAQVRAQELVNRSVWAGYLPTLGAQVSATASARQLSSPVPNLSGQLTIGWQLYQGGITNAQLAEGRATLVQYEAQRDALQLQVRLDVEQATLGLKAAREAVEVAGEALDAANERLKLAEGRYLAGAGSAIERGDAQIAQSTAAAQKVQAVFGLATARAQLTAALGQY